MADQSFRIKNGLKVQDVLVINDQGSIASADRLPEIPISKIANLQTALDEKSSATALEGVYDVTEYTDVQNETTFEIAYDVGLVQILYNGVQLAQSDFTATNGTSVVLDAAVESADDVITIIRWGAVAESSIIVETPTANTAVKRTSTGAIRSANGVNSDEVVTKAQLDLKANLASPTLTGTPAAPTANAGTNTTQIATTAFVQTAVSALVDTAPETLDTLNELAAALGDDPNFATTVSNSIGTKLDANTWNNSAASGITSTQVTNWDTAYGWGDHGSAGYAPANTTVTTNTTQTISGAKTFSSNAVFDGSVGIGTSSPNELLHLFRSAYPIFKIESTSYSSTLGIDTADGNLVLNNSANAGILFNTNEIERVRINNVGDVGIGTSAINFASGGGAVIYRESATRLVLKNAASGTGQFAGFEVSIGDGNAGQIVQWQQQPILFYTNDGVNVSERVRIDNVGNIGVNTSSLTTNPLIKEIRIDAPENGVSRFFAESSTNGVQGAFLAHEYLDVNYVSVGSISNHPLTFSINDTERMRLDTSGNLGIGTSNPTSISGYVIQTVNGSSGSFTEYQQNNGSTFRVGSDSSEGGFLFTQSTLPVRFGTNGIDRARIASSGNALIGTTTDNGVDKLQVNGSISSNPNLIFSKSFTGTFAADTWYSTDINVSVLGTNLLDTFVVTVFQSTQSAGTFHWYVVYKFLIGTGVMTSNGSARFEIPLLSCVGHAYGSPDIALSWKLGGSGTGPVLEIKSLGGIPTALDGSSGKELAIYVTKLN